MLRHVPVLATEILAHLPTPFHRYFDGTFGHGGHAEYLLSHCEGISVVACDLDASVMNKGMEFTQQRTHQITPLLQSYADINQI
jgi:16S rRNA C1402 N4-methylase RsmH